MTNPLKLLVAVGLCLAAGSSGAFFINASPDTWYRTLAWPSLQPPDWVFGQLWTALYQDGGAVMCHPCGAPTRRV